MKPIPLQSKILIEPADDVAEVKGKAYVPETEKEERKKSYKGKVVGLGKDYEGELKKGDLCYFDKFGGEYFIINGKEYYAIRQDDVFVVLK